MTDSMKTADAPAVASDTATVEILSGNEAIARGAWEAGVTVATAYPGTPSTEILETLKDYEGVYCEWSPNEKVAMEVAIGASMAAGRALVCMKHVGLNVAADPFFSSSYVGLEAGLVVVSADDPGMHSSQDEQDNRNYAKFARVPLLEPSDSSEAREFTKAAYELSERFDTPVLLRTTTRTSHSKSLVTLGERTAPEPVTTVRRDWNKYLMMPQNAIKRHLVVEQRVLDLAEYAETCPFNRVEMGDTRVGIITSGAIYGYTREALPGASYLKLGLTFPLPKKVIADFRAKVEKLYVVEESDPFLEEAIWLMGITIDGGKELNTLQGELDSRMIARSLAEAGVPGVNEALLTDLPPAVADLPGRPPTFCPGCSHRGIFTVLKRLRLYVSGDIGCYTMGALAPYSAVHTSTCMGASISMAHGMNKVLQPPTEGEQLDLRNRPVAIIGDSTFFHSGITSLMDVAYNGGKTVNIIVDNSTTAMTGGQENPGTGKTLLGEPSATVDIPALCKALGIKRVVEMDPYDLENVERVLREELASGELSVIIAKAPCVLQFKVRKPIFQVDPELCTGCKRCLQAGCGALNLYHDENGDRKVEISRADCAGCGVCSQLCPQTAIARPVSAEGKGSR
jgi:indolepyruvate ferredoxin oxidoreductase alpha subunit